MTMTASLTGYIAATTAARRPSFPLVMMIVGPAPAMRPHATCCRMHPRERLDVIITSGNLATRRSRLPAMVASQAGGQWSMEISLFTLASWPHDQFGRHDQLLANAHRICFLAADSVRAAAAETNAVTSGTSGRTPRKIPCSPWPSHPTIPRRSASPEVFDGQLRCRVVFVRTIHEQPDEARRSETACSVPGPSALDRRTRRRSLRSHRPTF